MVAARSNKKHYDLLTEILRSYLAEGFFIPARESSTSEIIALMNHQEFKLVLQDEFARLLNISDLVKFANHSLSPESHLEFLKVAENFITANAGMIPRLVEQNKISYQKYSIKRYPHNLKILKKPFPTLYCKYWILLK